MREIKFRAKSLKTGEWVYGYFFADVEDTNEGESFETCYYINEPYGDHFITHLVDMNIVNQYTGLKDKNGVEIYEGDILKSTYDDEFDGLDCGIGEVEFYEGILYVAGQIQNGLYDIDKCNEIEVIGNIYEDQELLDKKVNV